MGGSSKVLEGCWKSTTTIKLFNFFKAFVLLFCWLSGLCLFASLSAFLRLHSFLCFTQGWQKPWRLRSPRLKDEAAHGAAVALARGAAWGPGITATAGAACGPSPWSRGHVGQQKHEDAQDRLEQTTRMLKDRPGLSLGCRGSVARGG